MGSSANVIVAIMIFGWLRQLPRNLAITVVGAILLLVSVLGVLDLLTLSIVFPLPFWNVYPICYVPGFGDVVCAAFDPLGFVLDCLFWVGVSFVVITFISSVATRGEKGRPDKGRLTGAGTVR